jgi:GDSL-like lipase/acylhydrolase family protein
MKYKFLIYSGLSTGLLLPVGIDVGSGAMSWTKAAVIGAALLSCLWCSWPAYKSIMLRQAAVTISLLVVVNAVLTPFVERNEAQTRILQPNYQGRFEIVEPKLAGLPHGVQVYSTNEYGHRTNRPIDYAHKAPDVLRVATFGGSTTEGVLLDDQKTWPTQLGSMLEAALHRPVEVINTGVSGTRAEQHLVAFRQSEFYRPDIAVFMTGINDWNRDILHANDKSLAIFDAVHPWSFYQSVLWKAARMGAHAVTQRLSTPARSDAVEQEGGWFQPMTAHAAQRPVIHYRPRQVSPQYADAVREIIAECRHRGILCLFLDQPTAYAPQFAAEQRLWLNPPFASFSVDTADLQAVATMYNDWLATTVGQARASFCPIADKLPPTTEIFFDDCHFTENGSRLVAKLVSQCLLDAKPTRFVFAR